MEFKALHLEMKCRTEEIEKLNKEFHEMKREVEATRKVDTTRCVIITRNLKLLSSK